MAACVCRALRKALALTARSTRFGPDRTHAHRSVIRTCRSGPSVSAGRSLQEDGEERGHERHEGHQGHEGLGGAALWAALGFSLFGGREEDEAQRKQDEMILLLKKAKLALLRDQPGAAHSFLHQALGLAQQLHHQDALLYCYTLMANVALVRGQLEQAEKLFKAALSVILSRGTPENDNGVIEISLKLASIYAQQERLELAEHGFRFCVESLEEKLKEEPEELTEEQQTVLKDTRLLLGLVLDSRSRFWTQRSDLVRAEDDLRRSLSICSEEQGEDHPQTVVLLSDLASLLDLRGNRPEALVLVQRAVDLGRTQDHPEQHVLLCNMAAILLHTGDLEAAARFYHEALALAKLRRDEGAVVQIQDGLKELRATRGQQREQEATRGQQREEEATRGQQREQQREEEATRGQQREAEEKKT